jgi:hypothetical protein
MWRTFGTPQAPVIGPVASTPTVWRALSEVGELQLLGLNAAVTSFRRHWWGLLDERREGFPWLKVAGQELPGVTVVDLDASLVFAASEKENAQPTYKGGIGFSPNLATCDNTGDMLSIDPRPGGATSNCAADNIALLDLAVSRLPGRCGVGCWCVWTGPGSPTTCSNTSPPVAACGGGTGSSRLRWSCTDKEMDAIQRLHKGDWTAGIDQNGNVVEDTFVADLTGLLDLGSWHRKIPDYESSCATSRCTPATVNGPPTGRNSSDVATSLSPPTPRSGRSPGSMPATSTWKTTSNKPKRWGSTGGPPGTGRSTSRGPRSSPWPRTYWPATATWPSPRVNGATRPETTALPTAAPARPPDPQPTQTMAAPARRLALDRRPNQHLASDQSTPHADLTTTTLSRRSCQEPRPERGTRRPDATAGPRPCPRTGNHDQNGKTVVKGTNPPPP